MPTPTDWATEMRHRAFGARVFGARGLRRVGVGRARADFPAAVSDRGIDRAVSNRVIRARRAVAVPDGDR